MDNIMKARLTTLLFVLLGASASYANIYGRLQRANDGTHSDSARVTITVRGHSSGDSLSVLTRSLPYIEGEWEINETAFDWPPESGDTLDIKVHKEIGGNIYFTRGVHPPECFPRPPALFLGKVGEIIPLSCYVKNANDGIGEADSAVAYLKIRGYDADSLYKVVEQNTSMGIGYANLAFNLAELPFAWQVGDTADIFIRSRYNPAHISKSTAVLDTLWGYCKKFPDCTLYYDSTGITEQAAKPEKAGLVAYPNPFNSSCAISVPMHSKVEIFDIDGKKIAKLADGQRIWTPEKEIGSGIYLVSATTEDKTITKRIVLIR